MESVSEGVDQIGPQVVDVFDADAGPNETIVDTQAFALVFGDRGVGHDGRMLD
jgi:hypothetical protein